MELLENSGCTQGTSKCENFSNDTDNRFSTRCHKGSVLTLPECIKNK